jgi:N-acetyl-alpha-D-muramate 1-phosphate uridylyltransferase
MPKTAFLFAAGKGERMLPLTQHCPKPLLQVGQQTLIAHQLHKLRAAGIEKVIINVSYLANMIMQAIGDGSQFGLQVLYSQEGPEPLETGGGIRFALDLLGNEAFVVCNADVYTDFDYATLPALAPGVLAHLVLVPNPEHHPQGDFALSAGCCIGCNDYICATGVLRKHTYAGIALFDPALFVGLPQGRYRLAPILREAMQFAQVSGELYAGRWLDVGTPERLAALHAELLQREPA